MPAISAIRYRRLAYRPAGSVCCGAPFSNTKMSKQSPGSSLQGVRIDPRMSYERSATTKSVDFVYVNSAYVGSVDDVNGSRLQMPPTTVIREQYWACSKWPMGQRILAITVGVLLGAVISLTILVVIRGDDNDMPDILRRIPAPD